MTIKEEEARGSHVRAQERRSHATAGLPERPTGMEGSGDTRDTQDPVARGDAPGIGQDVQTQATVRQATVRPFHLQELMTTAKSPERWTHLRATAWAAGI